MKILAKEVSIIDKVGEETIEINGEIQSYHTGRAWEHEFIPYQFSNEVAERYYDDNWELIDDKITGMSLHYDSED